MKKREKSIKNLINNKLLLEVLADSKIKNKIKKAIINKADKNLIKAIEESVLNVLAGNIHISEPEFNKLKKSKSVLRKLVKQKNIESKKLLLQQRGGFLSIILPSVITGLSTIISSLINKKE